MSAKPYHHGDLRDALLEKAIEMINEGNSESLSMRKLAAACGVSHAAPYAHFANKNELLDSVVDYITAKFTAALKEAVGEGPASTQGLKNMGYEYALFFFRNPQYYTFIFHRSKIEAGEGREYEPYDFFMAYFNELFDQFDYPKDKRLRLKTATSLWGKCHGIAAISANTRTNDAPEWEAIIKDILVHEYDVESQLKLQPQIQPLVD
ncbi:MAG: TetR/AcrR family transcriptional regulator [Defluviitaleaceae bacterium]|nr:TetR/AcrR family transcriptional regulator [Defluviitaleaceae bacterium]